MSEYSELVKRLRDSYAVDAEIRFEAAQAIERLEAQIKDMEVDVKRLLEDAPGALIKAALSERMHTADAEARAEKAERELAEAARAREGRKDAVLAEIAESGFSGPTGGAAASQIAREALVAPAPGKDSEGKE